MDILQDDENNIFTTVGEDSVMSVWTLPKFKSKDIPTSSSEKIALLYSDIVVDHVLTGVQFTKIDALKTSICTASYDGEEIELWKRNENTDEGEEAKL